MTATDLMLVLMALGTGLLTVIGLHSVFYGLRSRWRTHRVRREMQQMLAARDVWREDW